MSERPGKGLWDRLKEVLGVRAGDDDLSSAPQVTSTFTAHRIPTGDGPLSGPLFPPADGADRKWELYEDGWEQTEVAAEAPPAPAPPEPAPVPVEPHEPPPPAARGDDLSAALQALVTEGEHAGLLDHVDDDEADALAEAFGLDRLPRRGTEVEDPPAAPLTGAQPAWAPEPHREPGVARPPAPVTRDPGAERHVEVHEDRVAQARVRARRATRPEVQVHDDHLERPATPVSLNPSEALALAERGRDAIGPRKDVGPAS